MATLSTPTASIAIPDVHSFAASVSPRGADLEGRLELSLDALIKERRKEHKQQKKEVVKKHKQSTDKRKPIKQQKPMQKTTKNDQKAQRKALTDKKRGLPTLPAKEKTQNKTKTSIAATTAKLRREMQADKTQNSSTGRRVVSPRPTKNNVAQHSKKKNTSQQTRKISSPTRGVQPKKLRALKQPKTQAKPSVRQVIRSNKKAKLSITITGQTGKKKAQKQQKAANKVLLPGKVSQALAKKTSAAKKVVNRSKNRKVTPAKNIQVVRKVPGQRKKN